MLKWRYLGDRPPWEQLVGEVRGLVLLLVCREGVRPMVLLGEPTLVLLEFLRWLCRSLVAPSWNVFGKAPSNMVNSGVFNSNREISTICAAFLTSELFGSVVQVIIRETASLVSLEFTKSVGSI